MRDNGLMRYVFNYGDAAVDISPIWRAASSGRKTAPPLWRRGVCARRGLMSS